MLDPISIIAAAFAIAGLTYVVTSPRIAEPVHRLVLFEPHKYPDSEGDWLMGWLGAQRFEDVYFATKNKARLNGWFFPAQSAHVTIMVHHGNTGNIADLNHLLQLLLRTGANVFVYDYRGYGKSESSPSVAGVCQDGIAAYDWLRKRTGDQPIIFYGESLGAAIACQVALARRPEGLILQSAFYEMRRIACESYAIFYIWPASLFPRPYYDNARALEQLRCPLLLLHGAKDSEVKIQHAHDLFAAAPSPKKLVILPDTDHHEIAASDSDLALLSVTEFMQSQFGSSPDMVPGQQHGTHDLINRMRDRLSDTVKAGHE